MSILRSSGDLNLVDTRVYEKIGNTRINISKEQAINIAENYLKTYVITHTFGNGTTVLLSNWNITGVNGAVLQTAVKANSTRYPQWNIQFNISNMPTRGLQGFGVWVWANDGKVKGAYQYTNADFSQLFDSLFMFPLYSSLFAGLALAASFAVVFVVVLIVVLRKSNHRAYEKNT